MFEQHESGMIWRRYPEAEKFVTEALEEIIQVMPPAADFQNNLRLQTGSRLLDWVDHLVVADGPILKDRLKELGYAPAEAASRPGDSIYRHGRALLPPILVRPESNAAPGTTLGAAIHVEDLSRFLMAHRVDAPIEGNLLSPFRQATVWIAPGKVERNFLVVERRGYDGLLPVAASPQHSQKYLESMESWITRPRDFTDSKEGLEFTHLLAQTLVDKLGRPMAACVVFAAEREYWQSRNWAGKIQKARQDDFGLGWENHDHHTFRSSRCAFSDLIRILETLGFRPRERFYAGANAGWGAQVMDQPECGITVFADVDLGSEEVMGDFAHEPLLARPELGTIGLWCALHGESILQAGLHHLAARLDFEKAGEGLARWGIRVMPPFSNFPHLKQEFTQGELWMVSADRFNILESDHLVSAEHLERFRKEGTIGSHLEIIQRGEGFKGFNQEAVSDIIRRTDPRGGWKEKSSRGAA